jgi:hypothetical protein
MKTFVTIPVTVISSGAIRQPKAVQYRWASKRSLLRRFQHFIETTDWDERYLCNHWIDKICISGVVVSALYFTTILVSSLLK